MSKVSRRKFIYAGAGVAAAAGIGYLTKDYWLPQQQIVTPTSTTTTTSLESLQTTVTETTETNPVEVHAQEKGIHKDIIKKISFLGEDGIDDKDTMLVDYLSDILKSDFSTYQKSLQINEPREKYDMQQTLINSVLSDHEISDFEHKALSYLHYNSNLMLLPKLTKYDLDETTLELIVRGADTGVNPELLLELARLPDANEEKERYIEFFDHIVDISSEKDLQTGFDGVLDEGLKYGRKYATLLQCLYWLWKDGKGIENFVKTFDKNRIVNEAWLRTSTSGSYKSDKWTDFNEVKDRLSSGFLSWKYQKGNLKYIFVEGSHTAEHCFSTKAGNCIGFASFDFVCLYENGYDCKIYSLVYENGPGHLVNTYHESGKKFISSNGDRWEYQNLETELKRIASQHGYRLTNWVEDTDGVMMNEGYLFKCLGI